MSARFLRHTPTGQGPPGGQLPASSQSRVPVARLIDWHAARIATRSCCCPARPVVIAIMPPAPGRPNPVDLLLCGHHYRRSRLALLAAGATLLDIPGARLTTGTRPHDREVC